MTEEILVGVIAFFSAFVSFMTVLVGYFKVWKPYQEDKKSGATNTPFKVKGREMSLQAWVEHLEHRCEHLENKCNVLEKACNECRDARKVLETENIALRLDNYKLKEKLGEN